MSDKYVKKRLSRFLTSGTTSRRPTTAAEPHPSHGTTSRRPTTAAEPHPSHGTTTRPPTAPTVPRPSPPLRFPFSETPSYIRNLTGYYDDDETEPPDGVDYVPASILPGDTALIQDTPDESSQASDSCGRLGAPRLFPETLEWFDHPSIVKAVTESYQSFYTEPWTSLRQVPIHVIERWWCTFRERYSWDSANAEAVRKGYIEKLTTRLRDNISKEGKRLEDGCARPHYMSEEVAEQLMQIRRQASFLEKSGRSRVNRSGKERPAAKSTQGSASTTHLAKKMAIANSGRLPSPAELYKIQHTKKDTSTFVDERSRSVMAEYEARLAANPAMTQEEAFYEASGGRTKSGAVRGLGNASELYYESSSHSKNSTAGSGPSQTMQLQTRLDSTQQELHSTREELRTAQDKLKTYEAELSGLARFMQEKFGYVGPSGAEASDSGHGSSSGS